MLQHRRSLKPFIGPKPDIVYKQALCITPAEHDRSHLIDLHLLKPALGTFGIALLRVCVDQGAVIDNVHDQASAPHHVEAALGTFGIALLRVGIDERTVADQVRDEASAPHLVAAALDTFGIALPRVGIGQRIVADLLRDYASAPHLLQTTPSYTKVLPPSRLHRSRL